MRRRYVVVFANVTRQAELAIWVFHRDSGISRQDFRDMISELFSFSVIGGIDAMELEASVYYDHKESTAFLGVGFMNHCFDISTKTVSDGEMIDFHVYLNGSHYRTMSIAS